MDRIKLVQIDTLSCEAILRKAPNGDLIIVGQCGDVLEPAPENRVYIWRSKDNGETWSKRALVYPEDGRAVYQTEVFVNRGNVNVFTITHNGYFLDWDCFWMVSRDSGYTWERGDNIPFMKGLVFARGVLRKKNGELLLPYHHYDVSAEENERVKKLGDKNILNCRVKYVETGCLISSDDGLSWKRGRWLNIPLDSNWTGGWQWTEPTLAELSDGTIVMLMRRNGSGRLWRSDSSDGGLSWCEPYKTDIPNPNNKPKLIPMRNGRVALLNTPNSNFGLENRYPLEIWISDDDMKSWRYKRTLTNMPGGFSYADGIATDDGHILFAFEFNRHDIYFVDHKIETL